MRRIGLRMPGDAELDPMVTWELRWLAARDVLHADEILCEVEEAWRRVGWGRGRTGVLVLTDLRLLFISTTLITRRSRLDVFPLEQVASVDVVQGEIWPKEGALVVALAESGTEPVRFEAIPGSSARAEELARSILYLRDQLLRTDLHTDMVAAEATVEDDEDAINPDFIATRFSVGRGVAKYVNAHGGTLYVWSEPFARGFDRLRASTTPPHGEDLVPVPLDAGFSLLLGRNLLAWPRPLRLARRWWHPRGGVVVDSGLVVDS